MSYIFVQAWPKIFLLDGSYSGIDSMMGRATMVQFQRVGNLSYQLFIRSIYTLYCAPYILKL